MSNVSYEIRNQYKQYLRNTSDPFCLYIDFPFCKSKCQYCIYNSYEYDKSAEIVTRYEDYLLLQLESWREIFDEFPLKKIYFGGGTPNLIDQQKLKRIVELIPHYSQIQVIKSELHPALADNSTIDFYVNNVRPTYISLGVQSFSIEACQKQNRLYASPDHVKQIVSGFQEKGVQVNIDLVALFGGDTESDWIVFDRDMDIACNYIKPDRITCVPNYKTNLDYFEQIPGFRTILSKYSGNEYCPSWDKMLSLDKNDIMNYGYNDHWLATPEYWEFQGQFKPYSCSSPNAATPKQVTLALGGLDNHKVYSYLPDKSLVFYSFFDSKTWQLKIQISS